MLIKALFGGGHFRKPGTLARMLDGGDDRCELDDGVTTIDRSGGKMKDAVGVHDDRLRQAARRGPGPPDLEFLTLVPGRDILLL